ncbi:hypothetical protein [uncultured Gimesia sp.]|uniref:hypothetical protein n=1 Tax=uncultured Gimesia sp. TaxID=1678688 RepID=UPI0030DD7CE9|tara:strand:- start:4137 stop:5873 length:1737 start_codon:yes stop_codon:yes gene_type:complete
MTQMLYVVTKTFTKRAWLGALFVIGALVLGPLAFRALMSLKELGLYGVSIQPFDYHFAFLGLSWVFFITLCGYALQGCETVVCRLPVSSIAIVSGLILLTVGTVVLLNLIINGLYRILFFDQRWLADYWPLLGPLLFLITLVLVGHSIYWSRFSLSFTYCAIWGSLLIGMFWWFLSRYFPNGFQENIVPWNHVTLSDIATMSMVSIVAWYQGTRAFSKVRSGTAVPSPEWQRTVNWWNACLAGGNADRISLPLSQPASLAQLHWRDSCRRPVMVGGLYFGIIAILLSFLFFKLSYTFGGLQTPFWAYKQSICGVTNALIIFSALVVGFLVGDGINNNGRTELKQYLSVTPLSDQRFAAILIRNLVKTVSLTYFLILLSCLLSHVATILYLAPDDRLMSLMVGERFNRFLTMQVLPFLFFSSTIFWGIIATMVSIFWTGRTWFYLAIIAAFGVLCISFILISSLIRTESITPLLYGSLLALSVFILGGTCAAYAIAFRKKLISVFPILAAVLFSLFAGWFACSLSGDDYDTLLTRIIHSNFFFREVGVISMRYFVFVLLTLIVTPFATIPLAVSWNRHR